MAARIVGRVEGRYDDRVASTPGGWVTGSPRALTRWTGQHPGDDPLVVDRPWNGPLQWLSQQAALAWGPTVFDGLHPRWPLDAVKGPPTAELGSGAAQAFEMVDGVVSGDGTLVAVALRRPQPRTIGSGSVADTALLAIVDPAAGEVVEQLQPRIPTAMLWGTGRLAVGFTARVDVRGDDGSWASHEVDEQSGVSALAHAGNGEVWLGIAAGGIGIVAGTGPITTREAHDGPVASLAALGDDGMLSGGRDGRLRRWNGSAPVDELDLGGAVLDLAVDGMQVAAIVGGDTNTVVFIELDDG